MTASRRYRTHGFGGVSVADIMNDAGLTHGAFYGQFSSKEQLMAEASAHAVQATLHHWQNLVSSGAGDELGAVVADYLSATHRDRPGLGCAIAALGSEAIREGRSVRVAMTGGVRGIVDALALLLPGRSAKLKRERSITMFATMLGGLVMARLVDDKELSDQILSVTAKSLGVGSHGH